MTTETKRMKQVAETIKRNFSMVLLEEGSYIYGTKPMVTVTDVKMTPDFNTAKIYLSVYNIEDKQTPILEMQTEYQRLRQSLTRRIKSQMRRMPDLQFYLDDTLDEMFRVDALFERLHAENQMGTPEDESDEDEAIDD